MAIGLLGGTFDPIHTAHLIIAEEVREELGLDRVVFVPAARPPHKDEDAVTPFAHRFEMVRLAVQDNPGLDVSDIETERPGKSYTIETVREFKRRFGDEDLFLIVGADSLTAFTTWKDPMLLLTECRVVVVGRPGVALEEADPAIRERALVLETPLLEMSSSDIRRRAAAGRSFRYLVPPAVWTYIREKNLYS